MRFKAVTGFEPVNEGFADPCLTTWLYRHQNIKKTGVAGFEPTNDGVKVRCLTAWLYPKIGDRGESNPRMSVPQTDALTTSPRSP